MLIKKYKHLTKIINHHDPSQVFYSHRMMMIFCCLNEQQPHLRHGLLFFFKMVLGVMSMMLLLLPFSCVDAVGYSYTRFVGPVAGPEHKIYVNDAINSGYNDGKTLHRGGGGGGGGGGGPPRLDYVAKPEYEFSYGVEDADAHILHNRNEMRDGDSVKGVYSLIDPDGALSVVKYTADETNGFQAEVIRNGISSLHGQLQHDYNRAPPTKIVSHHHNDYYNPDNERHHYHQTQTRLRDDQNEYHPSFDRYKQNLEQPAQINHQQFKPHNQYQQAPPHPPIIYHYDNDDNYNNNHEEINNNDGGSKDVNNDDYHEEPQPQYEVHEKPNNDHDHENQNQNQKDDLHDKNESGEKSNNDNNNGGHKKKKHHPNDDDDDDDDSDEEDDSEELEDYDEAVHKANSYEESDEYY